MLNAMQLAVAVMVFSPWAVCLQNPWFVYTKRNIFCLFVLLFGRRKEGEGKEVTLQ